MVSNETGKGFAKYCVMPLYIILIIVYAVSFGILGVSYYLSDGAIISLVLLGIALGVFEGLLLDCLLCTPASKIYEMSSSASSVSSLTKELGELKDTIARVDTNLQAVDERTARQGAQNLAQSIAELKAEIAKINSNIQSLQAYQDDKLNAKPLDIKAVREKKSREPSSQTEVLTSLLKEVLAASDNGRAVQEKAQEEAQEKERKIAAIEDALGGKMSDEFKATLEAEIAKKNSNVQSIQTPPQTTDSTNLSKQIDTLTRLIEAMAVAKITEDNGRSAKPKTQEEADVSAKAEGKMPLPIQSAAKRQNQDAVDALVAAANSDNPSELKALLEAGTNINEKGDMGMTALMLALQKDASVEVINALLEAGADVSAHDLLGQTPLIYAAQCSTSPDVVRTLINAGADKNTKDNSGRRAIDYLEKRENRGDLGSAYGEMDNLLY